MYGQSARACAAIDVPLIDQTAALHAEIVMGCLLEDILIPEVCIGVYIVCRFDRGVSWGAFVMQRTMTYLLPHRPAIYSEIHAPEGVAQSVGAAHSGNAGHI